MKPLEKFGEFVVTNFRDRGIDRADLLLAGQLKSPATKKLQAALASLAPAQRDLVRRVVVSCVDSGLHGFLFALSQEADESEQGIAVVVDKKNVAGLSGGLYGEIHGDEGWYARFSEHGPVPDVA